MSTSFLASTRHFVEEKLRNSDLEDISNAVGDGDNAAFYAEVARRLRGLADSAEGRGLFDPGGVGTLVLMGEYGVHGYGIREAQSFLRADRSPSYWNHCFVVVDPLSEDADHNRDPRRSSWIWESTIEPPLPSNDFVARDGVGSRRLHDYTRADFELTELHCIPNICLVAVGMTEAERKAVIDRSTDPDVARMRYDLPGLVGTWLAYLRDRETQPNPLSLGNAVYCSAFIQLAYDAAGIDLAPTADEKNTAPEHLWQTARWFRSKMPPVVVDGKPRPRPVVGWHCIRERECKIAPL